MSGVCSKSANQSDSRMFKIATRAKNKQKFYLDAETADFHFVSTVGGKRKKIPAHKLILANASDVFHALFYGEWKNEEETDILAQFYGKWKKVEEIDIKGVSVDAFKEFLKSIYCGDVTITKENVADVMKLAFAYDLAECTNICETFMKENMPIEDICLSLQLAIGCDSGELQQFCEEQISEQPAVVFASDQFLNCSQSVLKFILEIDSLLCNPVDVFNACIQWAKTTCEQNGTRISMENLREKLGECLYLIPFHLMTPCQIGECVNQYKDLFDHDELAELITMVTSAAPIALGKFKMKTSTFADQWKPECVTFSLLSDVQDKEKQWVEQTEVSRINGSDFAGNILLRAVEVLGIQHSKAIDDTDGTVDPGHLAGTMEIVLKTDELEDELLLKQQINFTCEAIRPSVQQIRLVTPIVIQTDKEYEIEFTFRSGWAKEMFYITDIEDCENGIVTKLIYNPLK